MSGVRIVGGIYRAHSQYGGRHKLSSIVAGVTGSRKCRLYIRENGKLIAETYSDSVTGAYEFTALKFQDYYAIGIDHLNVWNIAPADRPTLTRI